MMFYLCGYIHIHIGKIFIFFLLRLSVFDTLILGYTRFPSETIYIRNDIDTGTPVMRRRRKVKEWARFFFF